MKSSIKSVGQIAINAYDVKRAEGFYKDVLGLTHLFSVHPKMSFFQCGEVRLMLSLPETEEFDHPSSILYFVVEDIHQAHKELLQRGAAFERAPEFVAPMPTHDLWMASFKDSEGNTLALMSEVPKK